jgi:F0F1-type ATP synthase membrane subunit b/b'
MATVPKEDIPGNLVPASDLPKNLRTPEPKEEDGFGTRVRKIATEAGVGGLAGAFAPEILTGLGAASAAFPVTAPAAPFLFGSGQALRGARLGSAAAGAFGGAVGETAGQAAEAAGARPATAEAARFAGGMLGPEAVTAPARAVARTTGLTGLLNRVTGTPLGSALRTIGSVAEERGVQELNLTKQQQQFINEKLNEIRGGGQSFQPAKDVFAMFRQGADSILRQAETQSADLERQANELIAQAQSQAGPASAETASRISRLQSQLNASADKMRAGAETEANKLRDQAKKLAQAVRDKAATQAPELRSRAEQEANSILATADQEANNIINKAQRRVTKTEGVRDRLGPKMQKRIAAVEQKTGELGEKRKPSELGGSIRQFFEGEFNRLKGVREGNVQTLKTAAFDEAAAKERSGKRYQETKAYKEAISLIDNKVKNAETGLLNVGPDELKGLTSIRDVIRRGVAKRSKDEAGNETVTYTPLSFQALENMRRQLRDRAFGLPAEGYDAIGQQRAGDLAESIERIQREFSPGFGKYLEQYKADSQPLNDFKSKLGQAILGKSESDFGKYSTDEFALADKAFYSAGSVDQLTKVAGPKAAEQLARSFIANRIKGGSAKEILSVIQDRNISDWIGKFPALEQELNNLAQQAGIVERVGRKRENFREALRTQIRNLPTTEGTKARTLEKEAEREAGKITRKAETAASKLERQATELAPKIEERGERAAERLMGRTEADIAAGAGEVSKEAARLEREAAAAQAAREAEAGGLAKPLTEKAGAITKEAQQKADLILGKTVEPKRVADFLLRGTREEWSTIAPIISGTPGGKEKLASAVGQVIADRANQSLKGAISDMKLMADNLVSSNLMSKAEADKLIGKLEEVFIMPIDEIMRTTLSQRLIRNAIIGYAYPGVERAGEAVGEATR